jgi:pimeloyl-ACP methyl ester carboxylesterase
MAPKAYDLEHYTILKGLNAIPVEKISSRNEADEILSSYVQEPGVRQFLLKNLQRINADSFSWKINLPVISEKLSNIGVDLQFSGQFKNPTLFVRGQKSNYIKDPDWKRITDIFPAAELKVLDTGHWVQAEKPDEFAETVITWLQK